MRAIAIAVLVAASACAGGSTDHAAPNEPAAPRLQLLGVAEPGRQGASASIELNDLTRDESAALVRGHPPFAEQGGKEVTVDAPWIPRRYAIGARCWAIGRDGVREARITALFPFDGSLYSGIAARLSAVDGQPVGAAVIYAGAVRPHADARLRPLTIDPQRHTAPPGLVDVFTRATIGSAMFTGPIEWDDLELRAADGGRLLLVKARTEPGDPAKEIDEAWASALMVVDAKGSVRVVGEPWLGEGDPEHTIEAFDVEGDGVDEAVVRFSSAYMGEVLLLSFGAQRWTLETLTESGD